ncbi:nucleolus and neural progenitor protein [Synchiropus splendidus]|uniref:nucleolus and neural progenitor protein n=1 Tax=Synchiropus splendidus TaxID=270530 RepID=UPI00237D9C5F|nr:nucleolus and neural progenitor protein [Synchiropus splendidus]
MAMQPWNRVNIPFPSAVSSVHISYDLQTDVIVTDLLLDNEKVLKLLRCEIFHTEIKVLSGMLRMLRNSHRGMKTYKALKQVEQCINKLKNMNLDRALQDLTDLCPKNIQRELGVKAGQCEVPSQPTLEWTCLKVLGAAELMSCSMDRCSVAFLRSKQHLKLEEFITLNVVIISMISRLWVLFRGILVSLSSQYEKLLKLLAQVSEHKPMPFLTHSSLPENMDEFLCGSHALIVSKKLRAQSAKDLRRKMSANLPIPMGRKTVKEDLGVSMERDFLPDTDMKQFLMSFRNAAQEQTPSKDVSGTAKIEAFKKQLRETPSFCDMCETLQQILGWCRCQKLKTEKRLLKFLQLKCQRMRGLEASGSNFPRKLQDFKQEVCWALSPQGPVPKTLQRVMKRRKNRLITYCQRLKSCSRLSTVRFKEKSETQEQEVNRSESHLSEVDASRSTDTDVETRTHDDIDDIFASVGL